MSGGKRGTQRDYEQRVLTGARCEPCGDKIDYLDKRSAKLVIRRMKARQGRLNVYPCPSRPEGAVPAWHIGHVPTGLREGRVARSDIKPRGLR